MIHKERKRLAEADFPHWPGYGLWTVDYGLWTVL